jgi:hypothetical protein
MSTIDVRYDMPGRREGVVSLKQCATEIYAGRLVQHGLTVFAQGNVRGLAPSMHFFVHATNAPRTRFTGTTEDARCRSPEALAALAQTTRRRMWAQDFQAAKGEAYAERERNPVADMGDIVEELVAHPGIGFGRPFDGDFYWNPLDENARRAAEVSVRYALQPRVL